MKTIIIIILTIASLAMVGKHLLNKANKWANQQTEQQQKDHRKQVGY